MQYLKRFLLNARANPKTTAAGLAGVISCITAAIQDYAKLASAEWWTLLLISGAMLVAADQEPKGADKSNDSTLP